MELLNIEPKQETFDVWCPNLKWVFAQRLMQTWGEFSGDQLKMQGIEAMQKQLLIREKKEPLLDLRRRPQTLMIRRRHFRSSMKLSRSAGRSSSTNRKPSRKNMTPLPMKRSWLSRGM